MTEETTPQGPARPLLRGGLRPRPDAVAGAGDAGAVLRRQPPAPGAAPGQGPWPIRPLRRPSSIVDNADGTSPHAHAARRPGAPIVDSAARSDAEPPGRADVRGPLGSLRASRRRADIVGTADGAMPRREEGRPVSHIVGNVDRDYGAYDEDEFESMPSASVREPDPVPVRLRTPGESRVSGPSGPDDSLVRRLREAQKNKVAARARAKGVDPGAGSTETAPGVTRSEKTHNQYLDRGRMLIRRYRRELDLGSSGMDAVNPVEFVNWLFSLKPTLKTATWRPYRQSAKAILATLPHDDSEQAIAMIDADINEAVADAREDREPKVRATRNEGLPRRTSSRKEKRFPKDDFDKVVTFLRYYSRSRFAPVLMDWLLAGATTGLRPIEWQATDLEFRDDPIAPKGRWVWLYVLNAKTTNGRGNGLVRTLDISNFEDRTIEAIRRMSDRGSQWLEDGVYDSMQSQCSQLLYSVCERIFTGRKKTYALYSLRHQFVANSKSFHKPEAVSALVGHVVTDTATESYGKRYSAWGPDEIVDRAEPVPEEVATVRQRLMFFQERIRIQQAAGLIKPPKGMGDE